MNSIKVRNLVPAVTLVLGLASPAAAGGDQLTAQDVAQLKHLLQPKFMVAEVIEAARIAAEKCPGFHMIRDNVVPELEAAGATLAVVETPEFELMSARGRANANEGYAKDPAGWCEDHVELPWPGAPADGEAHPHPE